MTEPNIDDRILSRDQSEALMKRIRGFSSNEGTTVIRLTSWWNGELRWARNRVQMASDRRHVSVYINRVFLWGQGNASTNQLDDVSLQSTVVAAERAAQLSREQRFNDVIVRPPEAPVLNTKVWSDATFTTTAAMRAELTQLISKNSAAHDMLSAGYIEVRAGSVATVGDADSFASGQEGKDNTLQTTVQYKSFTQAQCSMTVRHPQGTGSGWAGLSSYDWKAIDGPALAERALQKCLASLNPVRIEPGRYTVVLEPQAVCDLMDQMIGLLGRLGAESGQGAFASEFDQSLFLWRTKLGMKVIDERITISHNPVDPDIGIVPVPGLTAINWIEHGVLKTLEYERGYALPSLNETFGAISRNAFRMSGGPTSVEEMITSTRRGLLVTRFSNMKLINPNSMLCTGVTRDGLWLIENGAISKPVKNMRITESPLFVFNQIDQLGPPAPVFRPSKKPEVFEKSSATELTPAIVPPLKANDFSFTALSDAV